MKSTLKDRIIFIGIGQCGGNIASEAANAGFKAGAINTSLEDLSSENMKKVAHKLTIGKSIGGCAKERKLGQKIVKAEYQEIVNFIGNNFLEKSSEYAKDGQKMIVYLCFSTSGGTGSGVGPILINILQKVYPEVCFGAIAVTPSEDESLIAINNSLKCLEELYALKIPILIPDNNNAKTKTSRQAIYNSVNSEIVSAITRVVKQRKSSSISNIDEKDKSKLLTTAGLTIITTVPLVESELKDKNTLAKAIEVSFMDNTFANINNDKQVNIAGFFYEMPEKYSNLIDYNLILNSVGTPLEIFEGIYPIEISEEEKTIAVVTSVLVGLSFPETKIKELTKTIQSKGKDVKKDSKKKDLFDNGSLDKLFEDRGVDNLFENLGIDIDDEEEDDDIDIESILNKY